MRSFYIFLALISCGISGFTQFSDQPETDVVKPGFERKGLLEYGIQHSISFSSLLGEGPIITEGVYEIQLNSVGTRFTPSFGGFGNYFVGENLSIQFEIMYAFYGAHFNREKTLYQDLGYFTTTDRVNYNTQYLKIPVSLKIYPAKKLYLLGGGYFSVLTLARVYEGGYYSSNKVKYADLNNIDIGILGGFGFDFRIVSVDFRYNYGLSNVFKNKGNANLHNSIFELMAHWKIGRN